MEQKELDKLQKKALEQFKSGESLFGKGGAFAPMLKSFIEVSTRPTTCFCVVESFVAFQ